MVCTVSVIIPANNEAGYIGRCLTALAAQTPDPAWRGHVIVAANACVDDTVQEVQKWQPLLAQIGWAVTLCEIAAPGKINALNVAEGHATGQVTVYLDADVVVEPGMLSALVKVLATPQPRYASGHLIVAPARSWITRHFARLWQRLPFMNTNVQGAGLFAVNRAGRARWGRFPDVIADDGFVRLMFAPHERIKVDAVYHWPMVEGFSALVKVRRRQDAGVQELAQKFPEIMVNESKPPLRIADHLQLLTQSTLSYAVYVTVMLAVKLGPHGAATWVRGR